VVEKKLPSKQRLLCEILDEVACRTKQEAMAMEHGAMDKDMDRCMHP